MNINQIAQQAMDYLDSVGIAADYEIKIERVRFLFIPFKRKRCFVYFCGKEVELSNFESLIWFIQTVNETLACDLAWKEVLKLKSPN